MPEKESRPDIFILEHLFPDAAKLFSFEIPPLESVKEKCDVVLDTNVLLLPYGTDSKSLSDIRNLYEKLKNEDRLFIPAQVAREFARNRAEELLEIIQTLDNKSSSIKRAPDHSYSLLQDLDEFKALKKIGKKLNEQVNAYQNAISKLQGYQFGTGLGTIQWQRCIGGSSRLM